MHWTKDPVHNGLDGVDLLMHIGGTDGQFVRVDQAGNVEVGTFEGAIPHIGEAAFTIVGKHKFTDFNVAVTRLVERMGADMLMAVMFGRSPYSHVPVPGKRSA